MFGRPRKLSALRSPASHFLFVGLPQPRRSTPTEDLGEAYRLGAIAGINSVLSLDFGINKAMGAWRPGSLGTSRQVLCEDWDKISDDFRDAVAQVEGLLDEAQRQRLEQLRVTATESSEPSVLAR